MLSLDSRARSASQECCASYKIQLTLPRKLMSHVKIGIIEHPRVLLEAGCSEKLVGPQWKL